MPFGFRRFSPITRASGIQSPTSSHQCLSASAAFLPKRYTPRTAQSYMMVTNAFRLPPLFSRDVPSVRCRARCSVTNAFRLPPLFSQEIAVDTALFCQEGHQCLSASAAFLPTGQAQRECEEYLSPMPFGFRRFSPGRAAACPDQVLSVVTNAFRLPPLFSPSAKLKCANLSLESPMPFGFRRFSPKA